MKILVACEYSGRVRDAFIQKGHEAISCDLLPSEKKGPHYQGDIRKLLRLHWDLIIAHPPCTYLCNSGVRWLYTEEGRWRKLKEAADFFKLFLTHSCKKIVIENPIMHKHAIELIGEKHSHTFQPWEHGTKEMKRTCLWLKGLPDLEPSNIVGPPPKDPEERKKWAVVHRASPGPNRWKERSRTYYGVAEAMADQWG